MKLEGVHHVTCITGDAPRNVDYYTGTLGLRLVKKTVNQDDPTVYHLFYADEQGSPGSDITFFEYPNATPGRAGAGMVHRVVWRVASTDALDFWEQRVGGERGESFLRFADPEGLEHELAIVETDDPPLVADHPEIPKELALQGFDGVRAFSNDPEASRQALEETLAFEPVGSGLWEARGEERGGLYAYDPAPEAPGVTGAGAVHHVAWSSTMDDHEQWQQRVAAAGLRRDAGHRPFLVPLHLLSRAERRAVRDRDAGAWLRRRRGSRAPRRVSGAAARLRAPAREAGAGADAAAEPS